MNTCLAIRPGPMKPMSAAQRNQPPGRTEVASPKQATILLCDDQKLIRARVREILRELSSIQVIGEAADGPSAVTMALQLKPDVVLMDLSMPGFSGIEATRRIVSQAPGIRVLAFSGESNTEFMKQMSKAGARGYLVKTGDAVQLVEALQRVLAGEYCFSFGSANRPTGPRLD
jgi:DNA-binding NarL/FixJ family response regulator